MQQTGTNRIAPIDTWRAIAALGVVWIHCWGHYKNPSLKIGPVDIYKLIAVFGNGVDFFFVISGFCLYIVWRNKSITVDTYMLFVKKRWLRIAPAFYAAAIIIGLYNSCINKQALALPLIANFLFIQNYSNSFTISPPFWSLAVEFHFYLLLPLFLYYAKNNFLKASLITFLIGNLLLAIFSTLNYNYVIQTKVVHFLAGLLLAWIFFERTGQLKLFNKYYYLFISILVLFIGRLLLADYFIGYQATYRSLFKVLGTNLLILGFAFSMGITMVNEKWKKIFSSSIGLWLGKLSYSIYLWHAFIITFVIKWVPANVEQTAFAPVLLFLMVLVILVPVAYISYALFETIYFKNRSKAVLR